jgi:hypothetical protein
LSTIRNGQNASNMSALPYLIPCRALYAMPIAAIVM